jgi:dTDP-4-amino-4,6-dideoxygalactose transaminase
MKRSKRIYLSPPHMDGTELDYVHRAFETNWIAPLGPNVDAFEESVAGYCSTRFAVALNSGTAAIHLALITLGVKKGDEVMASSFTFSATVNPIAYLGATPVLIDSEKETWNMSPELLERAIRDRLSRGKRIRAIIVVHLYGMPANLGKILEIAGRYEVPVIEDAAEALGSRYRDHPVGSFGRIGVLSFNGNKIITTSGGGAFLSNEEELIRRARHLSAQARDQAPHYQHSEIGFNYRMSNVLAGIGLGQMKALDRRVAQKREIHRFYAGHLQKYEGVTFLEEPDGSYYSNRWLTTVLINPAKAKVTRDDLRIFLEREMIEARPLWKPLHLQPVFASCPRYVNGVSERLFREGLCLPSGTLMTEPDRKRVLKSICGCLEKKAKP